MRTRVAVVGVLCIAGCAGSPEPREDELRGHIERIADERAATCRMETPIGSRVARPVCLTPEQKRRRDERTQAYISEMRGAPTGGRTR